MEKVTGFSQKTKREKRDWLFSQLKDFSFDFDLFNVSDEMAQKSLDEFSENTISNFPLPYGLAPNFLINGEVYTVPMVTEESSVVAAASYGAKTWLSRGGFKTEVLGTEKLGHIHFFYYGPNDKLSDFVQEERATWLELLSPFEKNMKKRGGGITGIELCDHTERLKGYYTLELKAQTCDAMGANFINTILEKLASLLEDAPFEIEITMSILSNYSTESLVKTWVECSWGDLDDIFPSMTGEAFSKRFKKAVDIAMVNPQRAVTHNKGIMNGVDSVILATGNDFRAIEACAHAYAARYGHYSSLSQVDQVELENGRFHFSMTLPLALGTVGGLTSLHPMAKTSLKILGNPKASTLMGIIASVGLAQNFSAIRSLVTTGIQKGHMKMHLLNILKTLEASPDEVLLCKKYFSDRVISVTSVRDFILNHRKLH